MIDTRSRTHANTQETDWTGVHSIVIKFLKVWAVAVLVTAGSRFLGWGRYAYPDPDTKQGTALFRPGGGRELVLLICEQSDLIINDSSAQPGGRCTRWILRLCSTSRSGAANLSCRTHPSAPTTLSHCAGLRGATYTSH